MEELEATLGEIKTSMTDLSKLLSKQQDEIKATGETSEKTAGAIQAMDKRLEELAQKAQEDREEFNAIVEASKATGQRIDDLEALLARKNQGQGANPSLSKAFTESDAYKKFVGNKLSNSDVFEARGTFFGAKGSDLPAFYRRNGLGQFDSNGEPLGGSHQLLDVYANPLLARTLRELIPMGTTTQSNVEYPYETVRMPLRSRLASEAASGQKDLVVEYLAGWKVGATLKIGNEIHKVAAINESTKTITVENNLASTYPAETDVFGEYFTPTKEGERKPEAGLIIDIRQANVETIAAWLPITRQMAADAPLVRTYIENRLPEYALQASERQLLYGDGQIQRELDGFFSNADVQSYLWSQGKIGDTKRDAIRRAITLAHVAGFPVDAVILHPHDYEDVELEKGNDGHYVRTTTFDNAGNPMVWRTRVVESNHIKQGDFLVGSFRLGSMLWTRESIEMRITDSHGDLFIKNTLVLLAEERLAHTMFRPKSFVAGKFDREPSLPSS